MLIILVEAGPRIPPTFPAELSNGATGSLERLCVEVRTGAAVNAVEEDVVRIGGERIAAATVLWAAGVAPSPIARSLGVPLDRIGRVIVNTDLTIPGHPDVFVIGDLTFRQRRPGRSASRHPGRRRAKRSTMGSGLDFLDPDRPESPWPAFGPAGVGLSGCRYPEERRAQAR